MTYSKHLHRLCYWLLIVGCISCNSKNSSKPESKAQVDAFVSTEQQKCNWCGTSEAPENVDWRTVIPPKDEPGQKLIISGTIYHPDGESPAEGMIIYVHHTNIEGIYPKRGDEKGNGKLHGYLRGWMKTDNKGRYEFETIRPAPYKTHGGEPAHIHYSIEGPGYPEYWLTGIWFSDDPRVTDELVNEVGRNGGFSNVIDLNKDKNGVLRGRRDIILEKYD